MSGDAVGKRLAARLVRRGECLVWTGAVAKCGYGVMKTGPGRVEYVHRVALRLAAGEIPADLQVDHLCRERLCCEPSHLEAVTGTVNRQRQAAALRARPCRHGHPPEERVVTPAGHSYCRACDHARRGARVAV